MQTRHIIPLFSGILLALALAACTNDPLYPERVFTVQGTSLPVLEGDHYYELWFSYPKPSAQQKEQRLDHNDADYVSVGKFRVDAAGTMTGLEGGAARFAIPTGYNPSLIGDALLTVERVSAPHTVPGRRMLSGLFGGTASRATARLTMEDGEAFGEKLQNDSIGTFVLDAPTSDAPGDSVSGIWFIGLRETIPGKPDTISGLAFAPQPLNPDNPDWTYQAWLVRNEGTAQAEYVALGTFKESDRADANGAGPGAGSLTTRAYRAPGEDFVSGTQRVLNDGTYGVVISIDPTDTQLTRPMIPILKLARIPAGFAHLVMMQISRAASVPVVEVTVDR